jgi:alanyl-tRNA synthetase
LTKKILSAKKKTSKAKSRSPGHEKTGSGRGKLRCEGKMTEKIYQADAYCRETTAAIVGKEFRDDRFFIRLDRTIFCPAGGGQPADTGTLNGLPLLGLASENDDIVHVLGADPGRGEARLQLDFPRRYDHMQQHTAQHLLSQVLLNLFDAPTLSFAIGPEHSSIEIGRQALDEKDIASLENECAARIFANLPVCIFESEDSASLQLRKPSKRQGKIRVVEITGLDRSACGGTHLRTSAEIGLLKIVKTDRVRANVRLYYLSGFRALDDYRLKHDVAQRLQRTVTQPLADIPHQVETLLREKDELRRALKKALHRELEREIAADLDAGKDLVIREFSGIDAAELRFFATALIKQDRQVLVYSTTPTRHIVIGRGRGTFDLRQISGDIFALLDGKGGGTANLIEGQGRDFSKIPQVIALLQTSLQQ